MAHSNSKNSLNDEAGMLLTQKLDRSGLILVVDDDAAIRSLYTDFLTDLNHQVITAADGATCLKLAEEKKPQVILLDLCLPDMSGFDICLKLKASTDSYLIPVILVTGMGDPDAQIKGLDCGANDFIRKPVDLNVLYARVRSSIKYMYALEELQAVRDELEERVKQRTIKLIEANDQLQTEVKDRQRAEDALRTSEERYALAAQGANDGLWDWDLQTGEIYFSSRWKEMVGCSTDAFGGNLEAWHAVVHADDLERLESEVRAHLNGMSPHLEVEYRVNHADGDERWMRCRGLAVRGSDGELTRMAGSQTDITAEKQTQEQLLHDAFHDGVTGLPNRTLFLDRLGQTIRRTGTHPDTIYAVLYLGIERFKIIVESLGFQFGDRLLAQVGKRLLGALSPGDSLGRIGGDEYAVLLENVSSVAAARREAERLKIELLRPFKIGEREVFVSACVGIIVRPADHKSGEEILGNAHTAMRRAKEEGSSTTPEVYNSGLHAAVVSELDLDTELRQAVEREEFLLHYQPIVSIQDGGVIGFEALMRWESPARGMVSPGQFIPMSENNGMIIPMTWWALQEAATQATIWSKQFPAHGLLPISVNLSSKIFSQPDLTSRIERILLDSGLEKPCLKVEITESAIMEHGDVVNTALDRLKEMGVKLLMDDFGTGYSSLSYLHQLPIDLLKIDRSFVNRMTLDDGHTEIVQSIISMAHSLNMGVVAEGIETDEQLQLLKDMDCEFAQGYLLARPMSQDAAGAWLAEK